MIPNNDSDEGNSRNEYSDIPTSGENSPEFAINPPSGKSKSAKRENYDFVVHKKTPYLARRGKPNPAKKKDGSSGDPIPFGNWYVYQQIDGKFHRFTLKTENYEEAKRKYIIWRDNLGKVETKDGSLSSLIPAVVQRKKAKRKGDNSKNPLQHAVRRLLQGCSFMKMEYKEINNTIILEQWNRFVQKGYQVQENGTIVYREYSLNTLREDYGLLIAAVKLAVKKGCIPIDNDLLDGVELEDADNSCPKCVSELTHEMFLKIRHYIYNGDGRRHPHTPIIFDVYWLSGGRKSSVAGIRTEDVDFTNGWLFFRVAKGRPKGYRIPMSIDLKLVLKEHITRYNKQPGEEIFDVIGINGSIAAACEQAGWHRMHAHDFRHVFACHALERTKNICLVAQWLGHTDGGILAAKVYATNRDEESERIMLQNMVYIAHIWSQEGFEMIRNKVSISLKDMSLQITNSTSQKQIETVLSELKNIADNPISSTNSDVKQVYGTESVIPLGSIHTPANEIIDWIKKHPSFVSYSYKSIIKKVFPSVKDPTIDRALKLTSELRKSARKIAEFELQLRLVKYLNENPDRYSSWALYDFPEATFCQVRRAILSVNGQYKTMNKSRDATCPLTFLQLIDDRRGKIIVLTLKKVMDSTLTENPKVEIEINESSSKPTGLVI